MKSLKIVRAGKERIDDLAPLWKALQQRHIEIGQKHGPTRTPDQSWLLRRKEYEQWITEPGTFILIAEYDTTPVGYAFVTRRRVSCSYDTPEKLAELSTLSVLPEYRGRGIGDALMKEVFRHLRKEGITQMGFGVVEGNDRAIKFYQRYGFRIRFVTMWGEVPPVH